MHYVAKVGKLWIPYIIFRNTDSDEAVTVTGDTRTLVSIAREGGFVRSGLEIADEVQLYFFIGNILYAYHVSVLENLNPRIKYNYLCSD